jgi:hypothetical protein
MTKETNICYFCDCPASSREHAPPKCFFPKGNRENLVTVPSCDKHNSEKSHNDEYMRLIILSDIRGDGNTIVAHMRETLKRSIDRSAERLLSSIKNLPKKDLRKLIVTCSRIKKENKESGELLNIIVASKLYESGCISGGLFGLMYKNVKNELYERNNGSIIKTYSHEIDLQRVFIFFTQLASALFFHTFERKYSGRLTVAPLFLFNTNTDVDDDKEKNKILLDQYSKENSHGYNKDIFYYSFSSIENDLASGLWINMCFYEEFKFSVRFSEET